MELILHPAKEEFKSIIEDNNLVIVDFWATWCGPCQMIAPIIDELAKTYADDLTVAKVDIDEYGDLANEYGVQSIPTIVIFKDGKEVAREIGVKPIETYKSILEKLIEN